MREFWSHIFDPIVREYFFDIQIKEISCKKASEKNNPLENISPHCAY